MVRPSRAIGSAVCIFLLSLATAWRTAPPPMSLEEAKKIATAFSEARFIPPPRTMKDITGLPDRQKRDDPRPLPRAIPEWRFKPS